MIKKNLRLSSCSLSLRTKSRVFWVVVVRPYYMDDMMGKVISFLASD